MRMSSCLAVVSLGLAGVAFGGPVQAQGKFDGRWSVLILAEKGDCDKNRDRYRYPVVIENGRLRYGGDADFTITGQVAPNGAVRGSLARGSDAASVQGRLSGSTGSGTWSTSGSRVCSGNWNAEKRS